MNIDSTVGPNPDEALERIQAWEEAPLLDEIAVTAGYRATLLNLGLAGIRYHRLDDYVRAKGGDLTKRLGVTPEGLEHILLVFLDEFRMRAALSRDMLRYHPRHPACPKFFRDAEWERRIAQPQGYPADALGNPLAYINAVEISYGIRCHNAWRRPGAGGRAPSLEAILRHLCDRFGTQEPTENLMVEILAFLKQGSFLTAVELCGARQKSKLIQLNADVVKLELVTEERRFHCDVCGHVRSGVYHRSPCPRCHGSFVRWPDSDVDQNRWVKHIRKIEAVPLVAGEHTAQITTGDRAKLEEDFKAPPEVSPINVLACSPTLELGIDVGGLDAVVMRYIPPRPDNYAQRGGRAGRRSRVGLVVSYSRSTPHDQYFFDKPREMIAGEVPAPVVSLGNRDVLVRHLNAIAFGAAEPGLAGRMFDYVSPKGEVKSDAVDALIEAVKAQIDHALAVANDAWKKDVLAVAGWDPEQLRKHLERLPDRIKYVVECTARQVAELHQTVATYAEGLDRPYSALQAGNLISRLLGMPNDQQRASGEADDRSAGYPLRRFAEFGILPGYEFPTEPAALRLLGDAHEEDPVTVTRRFGIGQFQPEASVYARTRRWKVIGLDTASPWNPRSEGPSWSYRVCTACNLRYNADEPKCPRCGHAAPGKANPSYEFAGFVAIRNENPVLDEEERFAERNLVRTHPQWDGNVVARWTIGTGWALRLCQNEEVRWLNEGRPPSPRELEQGVAVLHAEGKGYLLCPSCGRMLHQPPLGREARGGRRRAAGNQGPHDNNGHGEACARRGETPTALAITTAGKAEILRLLLPVPQVVGDDQWLSWGLSLGYSLLYGMQHYCMLGTNEIDFELEGPWLHSDLGKRYNLLSLAFVDPSLGGSGYLRRVADEFHLVARRTIEHLDHPDCETACYRCLKSYQNQRFHDSLRWPQVMDALEELAQIVPKSRPLETGDVEDPGPWLEAYEAGVGSPLELKFLRLFEQHGFNPQKQVPVGPSDSESPISVADFAVRERRLAIYIDGAAFHTGERYRRDRFIRRQLREADPPWTVEELRATDLGQGARIVERLREV